MLVVAGLVLREAARRRLVLAVVVLTFAVIALTAWGYSKLPELGGDRPLGPTGARLVASYLTIMVAFTFSFVLALAGVFIATPAISGEVETGIALAVLARPISRESYVLGKWLGLAALLLAYAAGAIALELVAIRLAVGYTPPGPLAAFAYLYAEGLVLLTFGLLLSTRLSGMVGGVVALVCFGIAWLGGIVGGVGEGFQNATLTQVGTAIKLLLPTDALWRGAVYALEPEVLITALGPARGPFTTANPFFTPTAPSPLLSLWTAVWLGAIVGLTVWVFRRREV